MISVIIPAYNAEDTIIDCVNGVLNQTRVDLVREIIVVDDGSSDDTIKVLNEKINSELIKIISKTNGGVSSARNIGINNASGKWIALLDSDDVWLSEKIERQIKYIKRFPSIKFIGTNRNNENVRFGKRVTKNLYRLGLRDILIKNWPHTSTALIKKNVFDEVGVFDESMRYAEDGNLWNRIAIKYPLYYIAESLEIAGGGKAQYGEKGLSANLKEMYFGNVRNLEYLRRRQKISIPFYSFLRVFFALKHIRRILLTIINRFDRKNN